MADSGGYIKIPKVLLESEQFQGLDRRAIILYSYLMNRMKLSESNSDRFTDEEGKIYVVLSTENMQSILGVSKPTARKLKNDLIQYGLLEEKVHKSKATFFYPRDISRSGVPPNENVSVGKNLSQGEKNSFPSVGKNLSQGEKNSFPSVGKNLSQGEKNSFPSVGKNLSPNKTDIVRLNNKTEDSKPELSNPSHQVSQNYIYSIGDVENDNGEGWLDNLETLSQEEIANQNLKAKLIGVFGENGQSLLDEVQKLVNKYNYGLVSYALDRTKEKGGKHIAYTKTILEEWSEKGYETADDVLRNL